MQLVIAISYPDGEPADSSERFVYYPNDDASQRFEKCWSPESTIHIFVDEGILGCEYVACEVRTGNKDDQIPGKYAFLIVKETAFMPLPPKARFH